MTNNPASLAIEAATFLKTKNPHANVTVREHQDRQDDQRQASVREVSPRWARARDRAARKGRHEPKHEVRAFIAVASMAEAGGRPSMAAGWSSFIRHAYFHYAGGASVRQRLNFFSQPHPCSVAMNS
jgi:hypothetical protein